MGVYLQSSCRYLPAEFMSVFSCRSHVGIYLQKSCRYLPAEVMSVFIYLQSSCRHLAAEFMSVFTCRVHIGVYLQNVSRCLPGDNCLHLQTVMTRVTRKTDGPTNTGKHTLSPRPSAPV